jgi:2-dehydropantoate 2-reductase
MRVLIIGAGVNGSLAGAALIEGGQADVTYMVRPSRQHQLIGRGLQITSPLGRFTKPVDAVLPKAATGKFDVVILATRANFYQMGLFLARDAIRPDTIIVPIFDGIHHLDHWDQCYSQNPIALANFEVRAVMDADGVVRQSNPIGDLRLGLQRSGNGVVTLENLTNALRGRRFQVHADAEKLLVRMWARHVYLAAAAGTSVLSGMTLRDTCRFRTSKSFQRFLTEGLYIGEAYGIQKLASPVQSYLTAYWEEGRPVRAPAAIATGGRAGSESLFLLSHMLRKAQDAKVAAPLLKSAWAMIGVSDSCDGANAEVSG